MNIKEIRQQYPQYNDLSDEQLARGLHQKFYADMPFEDFAGRIGFLPATPVPEAPEPRQPPFSNSNDPGRLARYFKQVIESQPAAPYRLSEPERPLEERQAAYEEEFGPIDRFVSRIKGGVYDYQRGTAAEDVVENVEDLQRLTDPDNAFIAQVARDMRDGKLTQEQALSMLMEITPSNPLGWLAPDKTENYRRLIIENPQRFMALADAVQGTAPERAERKREELRANLGRFKEAADLAAAIPRAPVVEEAMQAPSLGTALDIIAKAPVSFIADTGVRSLPQSVPPLAEGAVGGLLRGPLGFAAGMGHGSFGVDRAAELAGGLMTVLQRRGIDLADPEAVEAALSEPGVLDEIRNDANLHASAVGLFDALSGGVASRTFGLGLKNALAKELTNIAVQTPLQGVLGAAGEVAGQVARGDDINWGDAAAEFFGEAVTAPVDVATATLSGARQVAAEPGRALNREIEGAEIAGAEQAAVGAMDPNPSPTPQPGRPDATPELPFYGATGEDTVAAFGGQPVTAAPAELPSAPAQAAAFSLPESALPEQAAEAMATPGEAAMEAMMPGAQYVGLIDDAEYADPAPGVRPKRGKPIRREEIIAPLLKALDTRLYQGHIKGKRTLGFYLPRKEAVRVKKKSDLEVTAHEIAHLVDDRLWRRDDGGHAGSRQPWRVGPKRRVFAEELKGVSYDVSQPHEGFAEFMRLWMTQPEKAAARAPNFYAYWEELVPTLDIGPALLQAREGMQAWYGQGALARMESKIGRAIDVNVRLDKLSSRLRQEVFDDLNGILQFELGLTGERTAQPGGIYETARLSRAAYSMADGAIQFGYPVRQADGSVRYEGEGLVDILKPVSDQLNEWKLYAVARSAKELMAQGRENLFTETEIEAGLALETEEFARVFDAYQKWNKGIVQFAIDMGLLDPQKVAAWRRDQYIPFHREGQTETGKRAKGIEGLHPGVRMLTGGTANLRDVFDNMTRNATNLIVDAVRNDARLRIIKFAESMRGSGKFMVKIAPEARGITVSREQIKKMMYKSLGIPQNGMLPPGMSAEAVAMAEDVIDEVIRNNEEYIQFWMYNQSPDTSGRNIIAAMDGGKPVYYEVADPLLYQSIQLLNRPAAHGLRRGLNAIRRFKQATITLSLDFMQANLARDTLHAWVFSKHGFKPVLDSVRGMTSRIMNDPDYRDFIANGGGMASYMMDEGALRKRLETFYGKKGINLRTVINTPGKMLYAMERIADMVEMSTRLGEYKKARARGVNPRKAAYDAREVSVDFAMRGSNQALGWAYDSVMFLKAAMNSIDRVYRGMAKDANRAQIWTYTGLISIFSVALYLLNRNHPCYRQLEDWDRDNHWHLFLGGYGKDTCNEEFHLRFPKIWEVGAIASAAERSMETFLDTVERDYFDGATYVGHMVKIFSDLFRFEYLPAAIDTPVEVYGLNRNRFTGRQIEDMEMQGRMPAFRYNQYTSRVGVHVGEMTRNLPEALQISPARFDAMVYGYFNTFGMYGIMLSDRTLFNAERPALRKDQIPGIRRFVREHPLRRTKASNEFWDYLHELRQLSGTVQFTLENYRPDLTEELVRRPGMAHIKVVEKVYKEAKKLRSAMEAIYRSEDLTPEQKRERLGELQRGLNAIYEQAMGEINEDRQ